MAHEVAQMRGSKCRQNGEKRNQRAPVLRLEQHNITIIVPRTPVLRCYSDESRTPPKSPMCTPQSIGIGPPTKGPPNSPFAMYNNPNQQLFLFNTEGQCLLTVRLRHYN